MSVFFVLHKLRIYNIHKCFELADRFNFFIHEENRRKPCSYELASFLLRPVRSILEISKLFKNLVVFYWDHLFTWENTAAYFLVESQSVDRLVNLKAHLHGIFSCIVKKYDRYQIITYMSIGLLLMNTFNTSLAICNSYKKTLK